LKGLYYDAQSEKPQKLPVTTVKKNPEDLNQQQHHSKR